MEIVEKRFLSLPKVKEQFLNVDPEIGSLWLETVDKVAELSSQNQGFVFPEEIQLILRQNKNHDFFKRKWLCPVVERRPSCLPNFSLTFHSFLLPFSKIHTRDWSKVNF